MSLSALTVRISRPYSRLASTYDAALGIQGFFRIRSGFEYLVRRYGVRFASAADVGCGTGIFARYLRCCWGVPVFAVDRSAEMLCRAKRALRDTDVHVFRQDVRCLHLPNPVDLVTANFDMVNHYSARQTYEPHSEAFPGI